MSSIAVSVLEILSVHPCGRFISSISLQNLHCLFAIFKGCICRPLSNKIGFTSFGLQLQKIRLFGRRKRVLTLPICFYNILLDYDVSLHILVVLVVTIPTSPRISKTEFVCGRYRVFSFRFCCFSVTGSTGHASSTTGPPVLPATLAVLPLATSAATSGTTSA